MEVLNIVSRADDWRARLLSNFSASPFVLDGKRLASVEGFIQGIKFPEGSPLRLKAFQSFGVQAKQLGKGAERNWVWWNGRIPGCRHAIVAVPAGRFCLGLSS